jgi:hypothetical protein
VDTLTEAMERPIDHDVIKGTRVRNAAVSPPIPPPNPLLAATDYGTCCGYRPGTACDCRPDDGSLDALVERQEQRRRDESLRAAKAKVDALPADQRARLEGEFQRAEQEAAAIMRHGKPRPQAGVRYRPVKGALLGPGSGIETPEQAERIVNALRGPRALPLPVPKREAATHLLDDCPCPRPCCHTTGPNHHPACQEAK